MKFEFSSPQRVVFGRGRLSGVGDLAAEFGRRALVVRGGRHLDDSGAIRTVRDSLAARGVERLEFDVLGEPALETADSLAVRIRTHGCDVVVALGGGSVIDAGKAASSLAAHPGSALDYVEVVGGGKPLTRPAVPMIAIPTTAGTGTEATRNAVLISRDHGVKVSLRSREMTPAVALIDPTLTDNLPPGITASTGMDALTQLIESYVSRGAGPMTDALAAEGFKRALRSLPWAFRDPSDGEAREDMSIAAYLSGVCLANAGLGAVHGLAAAAGGSFHVPHGLFCGVLLPHLLETNINFLRRSGGESLDALSRFDELGAMAGGGTGKADALVGAIRGLVAEFNFPGLSKYGISREHAAGIAAAGLRANSMRNNPAALTPSELEEALLKSL